LTGGPRAAWPASRILEEIGTRNLDKPIEADAGAVVTGSGAGDAVVQQFASASDAEEVAKANDVAPLQAEIVDGTIVVLATKDNDDLLNEITSAIGG